MASIRSTRWTLLLGAAAALLTVAGCSDPRPTPDTAQSPSELEAEGTNPAEPSVEVPRNPLREAYFGDLHIHTSWSLDAFAFQVRIAPDDAYRYARGGEIDHISGQPIKMQGPPLDFMALTEHANYMGISSSAQEPGNPIREIPIIRDLLSPDPETMGAAMVRTFARLSVDERIPELDPTPVIESTWRQIADLADRNTVPGEFTAFVGYEYTSMPDGQNLHRNVIFRGSDVPERPFSTFDSGNPEDLWRWMEDARTAGSDVIAIPHNGNGSNGLMYERHDRSGNPIDGAYAEIRLRNEPVSEVIQIKGQSETHPDLSPNDPWARFQILDTILGRPNDKSHLQGSYARRALMDGLEMEEADGINPYRFGMIGASDGHNASSPVEEANFTGKLGLLDGTPQARLGGGREGDDSLDVGDRSSGSPFSAAGLAGVWARSNTREDLFDALRAREVFATSGPRILVRLFGGWDLTPGDLDSGIARAGYARGVPMGGELARRSDASGSPTFLLEAIRDPREAPLERLQIVKAWVEAGRAREQIFDIACGDGHAPEATRHRCELEVTPPNLDDCTIDSTRGRAELAAAWVDPNFDLAQRAFYYARVIQIPTCRWSTWDANRLGIEPPTGAPAWIQERAVTSPIWYAPE